TITVDDCRHGGTATSNAFTTPATLSPVSGAKGTARGTATIRNNARPGPYDITVTCNGRSLTKPQAFTVIGGVRGGIGGSSTTGATPEALDACEVLDGHLARGDPLLAYGGG
ncbi:hypothetical protein ACSNOJ_36615, partial [Streptomyces sp. URMC 128]|uniref:hypothetical protein n=1 Tax=Streptomyces sp. URMC 128 TaxID=3423404 RepID=UPI003F1C8EB8